MISEGFAPAKINLTLHVTGQRSDGYHLLDSLVVFAGIGDRLWFDKGAQMGMDVSGPFARGVPVDARNLVWRAAALVGVVGHIRLEKNLPHGAGLGGGSADAAAMLRCGFGERVDNPAIEGALTLGADVPVCLNDAPQRMQGIGERLSMVGLMPACDIVLVNPGVAVPTGDVFDRLETKTNPEMDGVVGWNNLEQLVAWLAGQRNDLEKPACAVAPVIAEVLEALADGMLARMSGSGSTCFGIYPDSAAADRAAARIRAMYRDWWVVSTKTVGTKP